MPTLAKDRLEVVAVNRARLASRLGRTTHQPDSQSQPSRKAMDTPGHDAPDEASAARNFYVPADIVNRTRLRSPSADPTSSTDASHSAELLETEQDA
jgi:hypothetical protein